MVIRFSGFLLLVTAFAVFGIPKAFADKDTVSNALRLASKGNWAELTYQINASSDSAARDVLSWYLYVNNSPKGQFSRIQKFIEENPDWPRLETIRRQAEKNLAGETPDPKNLQWFDRYKPIAAPAMDHYAALLINNNRQGELSGIFSGWWPKANLSRNEQQQIFARYQSYINRSAHVKRLSHLLYRNEYSNAMAIADLLGADYIALAKARKALAANDSNVNALVAAVPAALHNDEGFLFDRLQWRRKRDQDSGAIEILNNAPAASAMYDPAQWWRERHIIIRRLIETGQYARAYKLASSHKQTEGFPQAQAEWVSGWLALRFVNKPREAFEHFEKLYKVTNTPLSKSRGAYWSARASDKLGHSEIALEWYKVAATYPETFYGQLAAKTLGAPAQSDVSTAANATYPTQDTRIKAIIWLAKAGLKNESSSFLLKLADISKKQSQYEQLIALARDLGYDNIMIKLASELQNHTKVTLIKNLYPAIIQDMSYAGTAEWAFVNAIIRQESRFDQTAISSAGARGLMQLMPATAKEVAARNGMQHQEAWLTIRPGHNIALGSRYLLDLLARFDGNYAMAAAAYNAGPSRVDKWIKQFGDPRKGEIELIDWVELIPIYETRNYVQRVLEGVYVYRQVLKGHQTAPKSPIHISMN